MPTPIRTHEAGLCLESELLRSFYARQSCLTAIETELIETELIETEGAPSPGCYRAYECMGKEAVAKKAHRFVSSVCQGPGGV